MPLITTTLNDGLRRIFDEEYPSFEGFPQTLEEAVVRWGNVIDTYAGINLIPFSTTSQLARTAFENTLLSLQPSNGALIIQNAFLTYTVTIAQGMLPAFQGVPPPIPLNLIPIFGVGFAGGTSQEVASLLTTAIDTYFRTGTAINTQSGATVNWN